MTQCVKFKSLSDNEEHPVYGRWLQTLEWMGGANQGVLGARPKARRWRAAKREPGEAFPFKNIQTS